MLATSCGYSLVDYQSPPEGLASVSILTFSNDSYEPGIELVFADALRKEFLRRGAISVINDPAEADLGCMVPQQITQLELALLEQRDHFP